MKWHVRPAVRCTAGAFGLLLAWQSAALAGCRDAPRAGVDWTDCSKQQLMLGKSNLAGANLTAARLTSTDLSGSSLAGAKLAGA